MSANCVCGDSTVPLPEGEHEAHCPMSPKREEYLDALKADWEACDRQYDEYKAYMERRDQLANELEATFGFGYSWQDGEGLVYRVDPCNGTFVKFRRVAVNRTRREGETKGTLSLTEARDLGYEVEGKGSKA